MSRTHSNTPGPLSPAAVPHSNSPGAADANMNVPAPADINLVMPKSGGATDSDNTGKPGGNVAATLPPQREPRDTTPANQKQL